MFQFHKRRKRFKFTEKKHTKRGILSFALALILIIVYLVFLVLSYKSQGRLTVYFGSAGVLCMLISVLDIVPIVKDLKEENSFPLFPRLGLVCDVVAMCLWIGTYIRGFCSYISFRLFLPLR